MSFRTPINLMSPHTRNAALWLATVTLGALLGYLLFNPLVSLPGDAIVVALKPILRFGLTKFESYEAESIFIVAAVRFVMGLPNTILISLLTVFVISKLQRRRQILYATLLWPLLLNIVCWWHVGLLKLAALKLGVQTDIEFLLIPTGLRYTNVLMLITVATYLPIVVFLDHLLTKRRHTSPLSPDTPAIETSVS